MPLVEYGQNLTNMVRYLVKEGLDSTDIILVSPPPVDEARCQTRKQEVTRQYALQCHTVAEKEGSKNALIFTFAALLSGCF